MTAEGMFVVAPDAQDGLDRMLHPLGSLHVIYCIECGGPSHAYMMPEEHLYREVSSLWHCHRCGKVFSVFIGAWGNKLPQKSYDVLGVKSDTDNPTEPEG